MKIRRRDLVAPLALAAAGVLFGLLALEALARLAAVLEERRQGRLDRDLAAIKVPDHGAVATLGQMIVKSRDPAIVYELRPRLDVTFAGARTTTNDAGYRGEALASENPAARYRIVGIGDSYMFGQGVADEQTYLARLPALLGAARPDTTFETANLAVPGFNTSMEVALLESRVDSLHPNLILIEIVGNDLDLPNFLWDDQDVWSPRQSFLLDFVRARLRGSGRPRAQTGLAEAPREGATESGQFAREGADRVPAKYAEMVGVEAFRRAIARLAAVGRRQGVPVLALSHGVWFEEDLLATLESEAIPVLILRSALRQRARELGAPDYARSVLAKGAGDLHPSALGHEVVADELAAWIELRAPGRAAGSKP